jgi:hypothetical protein
VWEAGPWWTPRLQHRFSGCDVAVRGFRGTQDVIDASPAVVIFDASGNPEELVRSTVEIRQRNGGVFVIVIVPPELQASERTWWSGTTSAAMNWHRSAAMRCALCRRTTGGIHRNRFERRPTGEHGDISGHGITFKGGS